MTPAAIEAVLADFRSWLQEVASAPLASCAADVEPIDLHTLLGQFLALRHEVNLQTRAVRGQQEQNAETLERLGEALAALRQAQARAEQAGHHAADEVLRPLLKSLVDTADNLGLAHREVLRARETILPRMEELTPFGEQTDGVPLMPARADVRSDHQPRSVQASSSSSPLRMNFWARLFGLGQVGEELAAQRAALVAERQAVAAEREVLATLRQTLERDRAGLTDLAAGLADYRDRLVEREQEFGRRCATADQVRRLLDSVLVGYMMSLQRLERTLQQHGLESIPCAGQPFDPEQMEAVEVVADSDRPPGEVIDEVRPGYRWRDRVFRFAQVRVARPKIVEAAPTLDVSD